ncbi:putative oxidoreductase [Macroventuria anomochaeta]|uniref:Oxidoreductase n=1 Tax=Macroventuria anomochaeta TaxID=301207 RepID=A0ACB6RWG9_9PLEO|nr:putative oxidoreductase [Macroventuria anomochaeta]KAF2625602.1 putative oxidoreductase [Macroventuria anomochaeta]
MSTKLYPLRTALIGLSSSGATSWAAAAHLPGLLSEAGRSKFAIKALLNSSVDAANSAIEKYKLPADTKAYGSPEDLAADPDIDLVICNTRVDKHYEVIIPSIRAGKDVFVEWPIAGKKEHIEEIVEAAKQSGSRVAVGLQRRWNPVVSKVRALINGDDVKLGKLLSADARVFGATNDREILPIGLEYFTHKEVGGNVISIGVGHSLDVLLSVIGDVQPSTVQAKTQIQRPDIRIRGSSTNKIIKTVKSDVPDLLSFNAQLQPSPHIADDATLAFFFRRGQPFPGTSSLTWTINFQNGEIRVDSPSKSFFDADPSDDKPITIQVHRFEDDSVEKVEWSWSSEQAALPVPARAVSATLHAFADGRDAGDGWVSLEDAAKRAALIEKLLNA